MKELDVTTGETETSTPKKRPMKRVRSAMRLPRFGNDWRMRWLTSERGAGPLHRVASIIWDDEDQIAGSGVTACGKVYRLRIPGIFSRMGQPRCPMCCDVAGVPRGDGAPCNQDIDA